MEIISRRIMAASLKIHLLKSGAVSIKTHKAFLKIGTNYPLSRSKGFGLDGLDIKNTKTDIEKLMSRYYAFSRH